MRAADTGRAAAAAPPAARIAFRARSCLTFVLLRCKYVGGGAAAGVATCKPLLLFGAKFGSPPPPPNRQLMRQKKKNYFCGRDRLVVRILVTRATCEIVKKKKL